MARTPGRVGALDPAEALLGWRLREVQAARLTLDVLRRTPAGGGLSLDGIRAELAREFGAEVFPDPTSVMRLLDKVDQAFPDVVTRSRGNNRVEAGEASDRAAAYSRVLERIDVARTELARQTTGEHWRVRVDAYQSVQNYLIPVVNRVAAAEDWGGEVAVECVNSGTITRVARELRDGRVDLGIVYWSKPTAALFPDIRARGLKYRRPEFGFIFLEPEGGGGEHADLADYRDGRSDRPLGELLDRKRLALVKPDPDRLTEDNLTRLVFHTFHDRYRSRGRLVFEAPFRIVRNQVLCDPGLVGFGTPPDEAADRPADGYRLGFIPVERLAGPGLAVDMDELLPGHLAALYRAEDGRGKNWGRSPVKKYLDVVARVCAGRLPDGVPHGRLRYERGELVHNLNV